MNSTRFKIDEDLPSEIADLCLAAGHDAATVHGQDMVGYVDDALWRAIVAEGRSLITADVGFADARRVAAAPQIGIVLLRLMEESRRGYIELASRFLNDPTLTDIAGCVITVTPSDIRSHDTRRKE